MADEYIEGLQKHVANRRKELEEAERRLGEATVIADKHPDAARIRTEWWTDVWVSKDVHQSTDRVDVQNITRCSFAQADRAPYILYRAVPTAQGEARLYSHLHVDLVEGFRLHYEKHMPLVDALRSTTPMAEKAHAAFLAQQENEREEARKQKALNDSHKAQPVRVVAS